MSDQPVARLLPKHRTTQTQNKRIHTQNIHALNGIQTHDYSVRASVDSTCVRPRGYSDRLTLFSVSALLHLHYTDNALNGAIVWFIRSLSI
jgi:hypothetical protein